MYKYIINICMFEIILRKYNIIEIVIYIYIYIYYFSYLGITQ